MGDSLQKTLIGLIALSSTCIAIELVPISRQSAYWNRCFDNTVYWIKEKQSFNSWNKKAKESLAVGICNGAVYEPKLKTQK
tara:strand:- start:228 stop:470 length:243 start_codon:yes stop_codon:yes gene_type:complete